MAFVFWDGHEILFIDYLEKDQIINHDLYKAEMVRLKEETFKKQPHIKKKIVFFYQKMHHDICR